MPEEKPRILFIGHDSSLTGAPILLLHLIRLLKEEGYAITIYLMRGGKLENRYRQLGNCFVLKPGDYQKNIGFIGKVRHYLRYRRQRRRLVNLSTVSSDVVFNNTITNGDFISLLSRKGLPVLSYIHELQSIILQNRKSADLTIHHSKLLLTPSLAVKDNLVKSFSISTSRLAMLPYYFPPVSSPAPVGLKSFYPGGKTVVMGMGTATKRKGFDLFLRIAFETEKVCPHLHFVWIGGFGEVTMKAYFDKFTRDNGVSNFTMTGELEYGPEILKGGDIFLLTSREDPYPLVVIEAAQNGKPSIYFKGTGGIEEFLGTDAGWGIPSFDLGQVVELLSQLYTNPGEVTEKGENARRKAINKHEDRGTTLDIIHRVFNKALDQ